MQNFGEKPNQQKVFPEGMFAALVVKHVAIMMLTIAIAIATIIISIIISVTVYCKSFEVEKFC